jgi:hypothetical protein
MANEFRVRTLTCSDSDLVPSGPVRLYNYICQTFLPLKFLLRGTEISRTRDAQLPADFPGCVTFLDRLMYNRFLGEVFDLKADA